MAKRLIRHLCVLGVVVMSASTASATLNSATARVGGFDAAGTGTVVVNGNLTVFGNVTGVVVVRDRAGGAIVRIKGVRQRPTAVLVDGDQVIRIYQLKNLSGGFYIKGRKIRVELRSPKAELSMTALGRGTVLRLRGTGTWHLNGGPEEQWSDAILPIAIKPPPPPPPIEPTSTGVALTTPTSEPARPAS